MNQKNKIGIENSQMNIKDETTEKQVSENYLKNSSSMPTSNTSIRDNSLEKQAPSVTTTKPTMKAPSESSVIETLEVPKETSEKKLNTEQPNSSMQMDDTELMKIYIGKNYDKITTKKFNFSAVIFGSSYLFYRKMPLYGFISILATSSAFVCFITILFIIGFWLGTLIGEFMARVLLCIAGLLIYILIYGYVTNEIYLSFVKRKIAKIKAENADKDYEYIKNVCRKAGGVSIIYFLLGYFVSQIIMVILRL